ncbi:MAG: S1/P1 nuclease [Bacteriovoracaceae bacterium]
MKKYFFVTLSLIPLKAFSWGMIGHRIVGELASKHLTAKASKQVKELLGHESLALVSTWPDFIRSDKSWDHSHPWHYVNIDDGKTYTDITKNAKGDIVEAIDRMTKTLSDKKSTKASRVEALKFLVHFVGDLHQPLHAGRAEDAGGNKISVKWFDKESNLHRVWDEDLIKHQELSYTEYTKVLDHVSKDDMKAWQAQDIHEWIKEDMDLRPLVYDIGEGKLGYDYNFKVASVLHSRLQKSGIRLAGILNAALK